MIRSFMFVFVTLYGASVALTIILLLVLNKVRMSALKVFSLVFTSFFALTAGVKATWAGRKWTSYLSTSKHN